MRHLYFHSSKMEQTDGIKKDRSFEHCPMYERDEYQKLLLNEWGRIKTKDSYIHIIMGKIERKGCHWCGSELFFNKIGKDPSKDRCNLHCMECKKCGARGPLIRLPESHVKALFDEAMNISQKSYESIRQWDCDLVNPYQEDEVNDR